MAFTGKVIKKTRTNFGTGKSYLNRHNILLKKVSNLSLRILDLTSWEAVEDAAASTHRYCNIDSRNPGSLLCIPATYCRVSYKRYNSAKRSSDVQRICACACALYQRKGRIAM